MEAGANGVVHETSPTERPEQKDVDNSDMSSDEAVDPTKRDEEETVDEEMTEEEAEEKDEEETRVAAALTELRTSQTPTENTPTHALRRHYEQIGARCATVEEYLRAILERDTRYKQELVTVLERLSRGEGLKYIGKPNRVPFLFGKKLDVYYSENVEWFARRVESHCKETGEPVVLAERARAALNALFRMHHTPSE
jgi:hypothetical protein